jgi:hypothetical protein
MLTAWLLYIGTGAVAGILAGLLGIGGGLVIVPILNLTFTAQALPANYIQHLALGTSLATIIFTSISSMRAHHQRGALLWPVFKTITPGILVGGFLGSTVAAYLSSRFLSAFFVVFLYYVATQMLLNIKPKATREVPGALGMFGAGGVIGGVSSLVGIGGGTMTVPFLTWCNVTMLSWACPSPWPAPPDTWSTACTPTCPGFPAGTSASSTCPRLSASSPPASSPRPWGRRWPTTCRWPSLRRSSPVYSSRSPRACCGRWWGRTSHSARFHAPSRGAPCTERALAPASDERVPFG